MKLQIDELGFVGVNVEDWDINRSYRKPTITTDYNTWTTYITRKNVPAGILLTNDEYWKPILKGNGSTPTPIVIDPQPTKDSPNAVSSGGTYNELLNANARIDSLNIQVGALLTKNMLDVRNNWSGAVGGEVEYSEDIPDTITAFDQLYSPVIRIGYGVPMCYSFYSDEEIGDSVIAFYGTDEPENARDYSDMSRPHTVLQFTRLDNDTYNDNTQKYRYFVVITSPFDGYLVLEHSKNNDNYTVICPMLEASRTPTEYSADMTAYINAHLTSTQKTLAQRNIGLEKGVAGGVAGLDNNGKIGTQQIPTTVVQTENGKVPASVLPSYVDDVTEGYYGSPTVPDFNPSLSYSAGDIVGYNSKIYRFTKTHAAGAWNPDDVEEVKPFPVTGETGKVYSDIIANTTYRWSGSTYTQIKGDISLGETSETAFAGNRGKALEQQMPLKQDVIQDLSTIRNNALYGPTSVQFGAAQQLTPTQQVYAQNNMMGKAYSSVAADHSGLGKVYLAKNNGVLTPSMMQAANTVYVIQYDYTMSGNITVPAGCTLEFDGGSISSGNYTLTGNSTRIKAERTNIFPATKIAGTWNVGNIYSEWFGDITQNNNIKKLFALTDSNVTNNVYIAAGTYNVSALANGDAIIAPKSNTIVHLSGTIELAGNSFSNYYIVNIGNVSNVTFEGGNIVGDRDTHTGTTGEWGMGIEIADAHDVAIKNVNVTKCWGDGIYIGGTGTTYNISIDGFTIDDCRRQGISITEVNNATVNNGKIFKIDGTLPKACVDIEPNTDDDVCQNITISNCDFNNQDETGLLVYGALGTVRNINVKNCKIHAKKDIEIYYCENFSFENIINTRHLKIENARNIVFSACHLYLSALIINSAAGVKFTSCDVELVDSNITLPVSSFESCNIDAKSYALSANCTFANCSIKSDNDITLTNSVSKNLTIISTKGQKVNAFAIKLVNSQVSYLKLIVKDSEATGSYYAYVYSEDSVVGAIYIDSEIKILRLAYAGRNNTLLENVSFVQAAMKTYIIDGKAVVTPYGCNKVGSSDARPQLPGANTGTVGFNYFDKTLKKPLWWTGDTSDGKSGWVDATGADVPNPQS